MASQGLLVRVKRHSRLPGMRRSIVSLPTNTATGKKMMKMKQGDGQTPLRLPNGGSISSQT